VSVIKTESVNCLVVIQSVGCWPDVALAIGDFGVAGTLCINCTIVIIVHKQRTNYRHILWMELRKLCESYSTTENLTSSWVVATCALNARLAFKFAITLTKTRPV
jgi:hypothetical protein